MTVGEARRLLGLAPAADGEALAAAFRTAVKAAHPDRGGDPEQLRLVVEAHKVLKSLAEARLIFTPAKAAPKPQSLRLPINVCEALYGGERRLEVAAGRQLDIQLPAGLRAGEALRLAGAGDGGVDVMLRIVMESSAELAVRGHDIWMQVRTEAEALSPGSRLEVETPRGRRAFAAPQAMDGGGLVRLKGQGLPARGRHPQGDLILKLTAIAPEIGGEIGGEIGAGTARRKLKRFSARWAA
jgi:curved DNA-binding protein